MINNERLSQLADRLTTHLVYGSQDKTRLDKAFLIAQYLRRVTGSHYVPNFDIRTGRSKVNQ